jgi:hypothetical protein
MAASGGSSDWQLLWILLGINLAVSAMLIAGFPSLYATIFGPWLGALIGSGLGALYRYLSPRSRFLLAAALLALWLAVIALIVLRGLLQSGGAR